VKRQRASGTITVTCKNVDDASLKSSEDEEEDHVDLDSDGDGEENSEYTEDDNSESSSVDSDKKPKAKNAEEQRIQKKVQYLGVVINLAASFCSSSAE